MAIKQPALSSPLEFLPSPLEFLHTYRSSLVSCRSSFTRHPAVNSLFFLTIPSLANLHSPSAQSLLSFFTDFTGLVRHAPFHPAHRRQPRRM